jgi:dATP pyrophosphohydrolase
MLPINTNLIGSHIMRRRPNAPAECLIMRRSPDATSYPGTWQTLTGHIQEGETPVQAVLREIQEETTLKPLQIYSLNYVTRFYESLDNTIYLIPQFLALVPHSARIKLDPKEHDKYKWCTFQEAQRFLMWHQHRKSVTHARREFVEKEPNEQLKIYDAPAL